MQTVIFRSLHHSVPGDADSGGDAPAAPGAGPGTEAEGGSCQGLVQGDTRH